MSVEPCGRLDVLHEVGQIRLMAPRPAKTGLAAVGDAPEKAAYSAGAIHKTAEALTVKAEARRRGPGWAD